MANNRKKILIIEDSSEISSLEAAAFENAGFDVEVTNDGKSGLNKIKEQGFDLVIMDIVMPNKTGFEILNEVKLLGLATPIMVYSNMWEQTTREESLKGGAIDFFPKDSMPLDAIITKVKQFLS